MMVRGLISFALLASAVAKSPDWELANDLYQRTAYRGSLAVLLSLPQKDAADLQLIGQNYFGLADYKKATEAFEKALPLAPANSDLQLWLGRTYGRRAETASFLTATGSASRARQHLEKAVELNPGNQEAVNDLFDYYLQAPGFLGGGIQKAEALAKHIARLDEAEGHYAEAQLHDKRKHFSEAEQQLRRAAELAPRQVGRVLDVAKYLAKLGRWMESEAMFEQAAKMEPDSPKVLFSRADTYIKHHRNPEAARMLLERYLQAQLTPEDPPRERVQEILSKLRP